MTTAGLSNFTLNRSPKIAARSEQRGASKSLNMTRSSLAILACVLVLSFPRPSVSGAESERDRLDQTVAQTLRYLRRAQGNDGCWKSLGFDSERNAGITG